MGNYLTNGRSGEPRELSASGQPWAPLEKYVRQDDYEKRCYFRSLERVYHMNGSWYFATREGELGPYPSERAAQMEIDRYIVEKTELATFQKSREAEYAKPQDKPHKLELVPLDERPRSRPSEPLLQKYNVHI